MYILRYYFDEIDKNKILGYSIPILVIIIAICICSTISLLIYKKKRTTEIIRKIPNNFNYVDINYLISGNYNNKSLICKICELYEKGYVLVESDNMGFYFSKNKLMIEKSFLDEDDAFFINSFFKYLGNDKKVYFNRLASKNMRIKKELEDSIRFWTNKYESKKNKNFFYSNDIIVSLANVLLSFSLIVASVSLYLIPIITLIAITISFILLYLVTTIHIRKSNYDLLYFKWLKYKNYLSNCDYNKLCEKMEFSKIIFLAIALNIDLLNYVNIKDNSVMEIYKLSNNLRKRIYY